MRWPSTRTQAMRTIMTPAVTLPRIMAIMKPTGRNHPMAAAIGRRANKARTLTLFRNWRP
jgi:hypothetical protein